MIYSQFARLRERVFVFTLLWIGFVLAISFMEAPLKFQAPSLTLPVALEIGYLVFHALNGVEIGLALVISAFTILAEWSQRIRRITALIGTPLARQTALLYTVLDGPPPCHHQPHGAAGAILSPDLCWTGGRQAAAPAVFDPSAAQ